MQHQKYIAPSAGIRERNSMQNFQKIAHFGMGRSPYDGCLNEYKLIDIIETCFLIHLFNEPFQITISSSPGQIGANLRFKSLNFSVAV